MGQQIHGEFASADASALSEANSRITLYPAGSTSAITLGATDQVIVTDIIAVVSVALTVTLYDGTDNTVDAGEQILKGAFAANSGVGAESVVGHTCQAGTWPKVKTSGAGQIYVTIRGYMK